MATTTFHRKIAKTPATRQQVTGAVLVLIAVLIWILFATPVTSDKISTFGLALGTAPDVPNLEMPSQGLLYTLAAISAFLGMYQIVRGFQKWTTAIIGVVAGMFVLGFLIWATAGKSMNFTGLMQTTLLKAVPLTLGALSGILCERSGVTNIAIEGMMLGSAMVSTLVASLTDNLWLGLLSGMLTSALLALILGWLSIKYKVNQIIVGTVINIFATGLTSYISSKFLQVYQDLNSPGTFPRWNIPGLSEIPVIGPIFFANNIFVYIMFILLIAIHFGLFYTKWGLRVRSVGEHPKAADTLGINVFKTRYMSVVLGGLVAGIGGAYFTLGSVGRFDEVMTAGRGFIGLAAMIFGNWMPFGSFAAGLLFGFADSLASKMAILNVAIPSDFLLMLPYIATMIILAGVVGRSQAPAADGEAYEKE